jgi:hypothetical protein
MFSVCISVYLSISFSFSLRFASYQRKEENLFFTEMSSLLSLHACKNGTSEFLGSFLFS